MKKLWKWRRRRDPFAVDDDARISLWDLERALSSVEPAARLVLPRVLRRVVRLHASLPGMGFRVPHSKTYVIPQAALLEIADRDEIGFGGATSLKEDVILLERPNSETLEERPRGEILLHYWELLFHARVHEEFHRRIKLRQFGAADAAPRLAALGSLEFDEIRSVLRQERFLLPPYDDPATYIEFAAVYLGLRYFQPALTCSFFPALVSQEKVDQVLAQDIHVESLLEATRLPCTPQPEELREAARKAAEAFDADPESMLADHGEESQPYDRAARWSRGRQRSETKYLAWSQAAQRQAARGNLAGAAIRRARAEFWAPRGKAAEAATALREDVHALVDRLQAALGIEGDEPRPWREALLALAHQTPRGLWTVEARLIYDLQKVCVDQDQTISTVDVMQWILSLGRRPIRRELPNQRLVLVSRHLRSAQRRLPSVRISERQRRQLAEVLAAVTKTAEGRLRDSFRPKITAALDEVGLLPQNLVETVSRRKLAEELLDRIVERGFLTMGEVRDAVSRNHLKQPDCAGPVDFLRGDAVLRLNQRMARTLDGVYERGDFYLRWIQRFSLAAFGTFVGRCLTKYLAIPYGVAVVILVVAEHLGHLVTGREEFYAPTWNNWESYGPTLLVGSFLFGLIHVPWFRQTYWELFKLAGWEFKRVFYDSFRWLFALPLAQWVFGSQVTQFLFCYVVKPLLPTLIIWGLLPGHRVAWPMMIEMAAIFVLQNVLINSRLGRTTEEVVFDWSAETVHRFGIRFLVGQFWFWVDMFRRLMQLIERLMYAVDEWLRFKSGQSLLTMVFKGALGVVWFFIAYAIRFCVTLLIEPQLNPVKHVPWVTVSHKILAPMWIAMNLHGLLRHHMNAALADVMTFLIVTLTPGIFGFLIWELTMNWRLFAANRPKNLRPVAIGSHGETLSRLLRPGFHSGTIPKRFAKLRRAARKELSAAGDPRAARKQRELLHHVELFLRRYIEREFIAWFEESGDPSPQVEEIHLATRAIFIEVALGGAFNGPLRMIFELVDGRMRLALSGHVCGHELTGSAGRTFRLAIIGLLKTGGADVFDGSLAEAAADKRARPPQEVCGLVMPWDEWVALWESGEAQEGIGWEQVRVI